MKQIVVVAGVIRQDNRTLLAQRFSNDSEGDKWEFPGGKVEWGEDPRESLRRELLEELQITVDVSDLLEAVSTVKGETHLVLLYFRCRITSGLPTPLECQQVAWFEPGDVESLEMPAVDHLFWVQLRKKLS